MPAAAWPYVEMMPRTHAHARALLYSIKYTAVFDAYINYIYSRRSTAVEVLFMVLFVKVTVFILLLFASLPDCAQNQTAVSYKQYSLSDF